jgi:hypothetical protein
LDVRGHLSLADRPMVSKAACDRDVSQARSVKFWWLSFFLQPAAISALPAYRVYRL